MEYRRQRQMCIRDSFWGGLFNTFFWIDPTDASVGVFSTHHFPVQYNIIDDVEDIVDAARR